MTADTDRRSRQERADIDYMARVARQLPMARTCAEEIAEVVVLADLDDEDSIQSSVKHIDAIAANARIFLLEALENKRARKALEG